jgi:hypothetical protein
MTATGDESPAESPLGLRARGPARRRRARSRMGPARLVRAYGPVLVVALAVAAVVVLRGGCDDGAGPSQAVSVDREALIRSGPMTPEKAELLGQDVDAVDFGPRCDPATGRIRMPSVYAPPCVEPVAGGNGGSTSMGVTGDSIKVVAYVTDPTADRLRAGAATSAGVEMDPEVRTQTVRRYAELYNRLFETYGRRVEVVPYTSTGSADDEEVAKADAIAISEMEPFAVIGGPEQASAAFADELAARGVICLEGCAVGLSQEFLETHAPYVWMPGTTEQSVEATAEAVGKLAGPGPATMAGDADLRESDRVYGLVHYDTPDGFYEEAHDVMVDRLSRYGIEVAADVPYVLDPNRAQETARTTIAQLEARDVTTVLFVGDPLTPISLTHEATAQDYYPEWIHGSGYLVDTNEFGNLYAPEQWANGFGLATTTPSGDELANYSLVYRWAYGEPPPTEAAAVSEPPLRALFIGVQLAGPELTPDTFRDGLFRYPPTGGGPTRPRVSYDYVHGDGDAAVIWWDPDAAGVADGQGGEGMYRFAGDGRRYATGEFPNSPVAAGLFDGGSSVVEYRELPAGDRSPNYRPPNM